MKPISNSIIAPIAVDGTGELKIDQPTAVQRVTPKPSQADITRFWRYVDKSGGPDACWIYDTGKPSASRRNFTYMVDRALYSMAVSRFAWFITYGEPPADKPWILHAPLICHNPDCCNVYRHLRAGTPQENSHDRFIDGTATRREGGAA